MAAQKTEGKHVQRSVLRSLLTRPVAFHPVLARICDSVTAGLLLSQAVYWSERTSDQSGWFWKTQEEWTEETYLSKSEQLTARKTLARLGFMRSERRGLPAKLYYFVDVERVWEAIKHQCENRESRLQDSCHLDCGDPSSRDSEQQDRRNPAIKSADNLQTFYSESTAENTSISTPEGATIKQALLEWIKAKERLKEILAPEEWSLWVRPAYLLKVMSGNTFLVALPPSNRIATAARARLPDLCNVLGRAVGFTRYPDEYERERMKKDYPEIYAQWLGRKEG